MLTWDAKRFFLFGMRFFFGIWLLYGGFYIKWIAFGSGNFVNTITTDFDKTWSPHVLNVTLAWIILIAEPVMALLILSGIKPRIIWALTSLLMFMLLFGQSMLMKSDPMSNWFYVVLTLACAALSPPPPSPSTMVGPR